MKILVPPTTLAVSPLSIEYFNRLQPAAKLDSWNRRDCEYWIGVEGDRVMVGAQHVLAAIYFGIPMIWVNQDSVGEQYV